MNGGPPDGDADRTSAGPAPRTAMRGRARDDARVYQTTGDQHISEQHIGEQHHHYGSPGPAIAGPDSVRRPTVGRAPTVLRDRAEVLARLREGVAPGRGGEVYVLHGMGGCGKTALAYAFFHVATAEYGRVGLWVNASDRAALRAGMLAVAADRGAADGELLAARNGYRPAADLVWDRLDRSAEPWLLVLDNADDPAVLHDGSWLRGSRRGTVVVTTRRAAARWWPGARLQHIGVLPREDAARVLHDLAPDSGSLAEAAAVADRLGRLPLALTLAGGFLAHQVIEPWTMGAYERRLAQDEGIRLIDQGADSLTDDDPRHLVGRTWQLTLDAFEAGGLPEAVALLRLLARLAPEPLPLSVLNHPAIGAVLPRERAEPALRALLDHSLTELVEEGGVRCVRSHGVLLDSVAAATPSGATAELDSAARQLLDAAVPAVPDAGPYDVRLRLLAPHVLAVLRRTADPEPVAQGLATAVRLGTALYRTGDYVSAAETVRSAADLAEPGLGAEHRTLLAARSRAGRALFRLGRYDEAERVLRRTYAAQVRLFGECDADSLDTAHGLQLVLRNSGRQADAVALLRATAAGREATLGAWHPLTLRTRSSLLALLSAEDLSAPEDAVLLALPEECAEHLGRDHFVTLGARHNRARALFVLGRYTSADTEISDVMDAYLRRFGPDHPLVQAARLLYARTRAAIGDRETAAALARDVVAHREVALGADHPFTVMSRRVLSEIGTR